MINKIGLTLIFFFLSVANNTCHGDLIEFSDDISFRKEVGTNIQIVDFDNAVAGESIHNGQTIEGIEFLYDFGDVNMQIANTFDTSSSPNFLGTTDGDVFQSGDNFTLQFTKAKAFSLRIITADELTSGDIKFNVNGQSFLLDTATVENSLTDDGKVYFFGLLDNGNSGFSSIDIESIDGGFFLFNVDDIQTSAVPEPNSWMLLVAFFGFASCRKRACR